MEMRDCWEVSVTGREFPSGMYCFFPENGDEWDQLRGRQVGWVGPKGGVWRPLPEWRPPILWLATFIITRQAFLSHVDKARSESSGTKG